GRRARPGARPARRAGRAGAGRDRGDRTGPAGGRPGRDPRRAGRGLLAAAVPEQRLRDAAVRVRRRGHRADQRRHGRRRAGVPGGDGVTVLVVAGTGTGVGKTACTAAYAATAAAAGERVAALKPAQTGVRPGEPGDADEVARLVPEAEVRELARYPEPLAPATASRRSCLPPVTAGQAAGAAADL